MYIDLLVQILMKRIFSTDFRKILKYKIFIKIRAVEAELPHAEGWTYRRDETNSLFFHSFVKKPKNVRNIHRATQSIATIQKQFLCLS